MLDEEIPINDIRISACTLTETDQTVKLEEVEEDYDDYDDYDHDELWISG